MQYRLRTIVMAAALFISLVQADEGTYPVEPKEPWPHSPVVVTDATDAQIRRTDGGGSEVPFPGFEPIELLQMRIGPWNAEDAFINPFDGAFLATGQFLRLDLYFGGLVNPPGLLGFPHAPTSYGPRPLYGFIELDVDNNVDTGGEIIDPEFRYDSNVARFGGHPTGEAFYQRINLDGRDSDLNPFTPPHIDRSGEDFHFYFVANQIEMIIPVVGDGDTLFESGERWRLVGHFLQRARGYQDLTFAGDYDPLVFVEFTHLLPQDVTRVSLVYPLTNDAFAAMEGVASEPVDANPGNANSIHEALWELHLSAESGFFDSETYSILTSDWLWQEPTDYLDPREWRLTALVGTVVDELAGYEGGIFVHTDVWPNVMPGDFNADGYATATDAQTAAAYIAANDGLPPADADLEQNGSISIGEFGIRFHMFDVNYDGLIDDVDIAYSTPAPGDFNNDGQIDLLDVAAFQRCFAIDPDPGEPQGDEVSCIDGLDFDDEGGIELSDWAVLAELIGGPN